jgi:hypothetical protein
MTQQEWDAQLTAYAARDWRATFFPVGIAHSVVRGSARGADAVAGGADGDVGRAQQDRRDVTALFP